ncbi:MAG TPA: hypothetical protein VFQ59_03645 [Candidatus Paceibacterota bacterium]|nr:hypothetical protein [Candidatus Paceibacterota bacterium]
MIHFLCGDDAVKKRAEYDKLIKSLPKGTEMFFIRSNEFDRVQAESLYRGAGLFFSRCAVVLDGVMEREEPSSFLTKNLKEIADSENIFIFLEGKHPKVTLDIFKKAGAKVSVFEVEKKKENAKFNSFALANAFGVRDRLSLWIGFRQAMEAGMELEPLAGILFWKVKDMLLKKQFGKYTEAELQHFAEKISYLLPESRRQGRDAESAFEQFLLEV